jgi:hypothetical protein
MVWDFNGQHPRSRAGDIIYKHTKSTEDRDAVNRILDLVDTLSHKHFSSPTELRAYFVRGSEPLFSAALAEKVHSRFYTKKGGAQGFVGDGVELFGQQMVSWIFGEKPENSSIYNTVFVLKNIERDGISFLPFVTPDLIRAGTEIFVEFLLSLAAASEAGAKIIIAIVTLGLAPSGITEGVGAVLKTFIALLASIISTSRGDFETGFESVLLAVPFVGLALNKVYKSEEKLTGKYKARLMNALNNVPGLQELATGSAPAPVPVTKGGRTRRKRVKHMRRYKNKQRRHRWTRRQ